MAVKWNKIYRGGVHRTTPETVEAQAPATGSLLPGMLVSKTAATNTFALAASVPGTFYYVVGEPMHETVEYQYVGADITPRAYSPKSGDLYAGRAAAGIAIADDLPLSVNAQGLLVAAAAPEDAICYVDAPASAWTGTPTPTTAGQLIPIKFK